MTRVHFVYPHGPSISCPDAIGRNVAERLKEHYDVLQYDWDDTRLLEPGPDDVLLGHPHPAPWTIFRRSARRRGWRRILILAPYNHDPRQVAFLDPLIPRCDVFLAITGNFWFQSLQHSLFSHWAPKMIHVDLAVDRQDFPAIKTQFNSLGSRRFLYIGHAGFAKNVSYLEELAGRLPPNSISWMGSGQKHLNNVTSLGRRDFTHQSARELVAEHDFLLTVGHADANPAVILEGMAWGLVPVCTPTSGYVGYSGIINIPLENPARAMAVIEHLQTTPQSFLTSMQHRNWRALDTHFNWDRFAGQVLEAITSNREYPSPDETLGRRTRLLFAALTSSNSMLRRTNLRLLAS